MNDNHTPHPSPQQPAATGEVKPVSPRIAEKAPASSLPNGSTATAQFGGVPIGSPPPTASKPKLVPKDTAPAAIQAARPVATTGSSPPADKLPSAPQSQVDPPVNPGKNQDASPAGQNGPQASRSGPSPFPRPAAASTQSGPAPTKKSPPPRPYYLPEDIQYGELSTGLRAALEGMILPASEKLVAGEADPIAQSSGATATFEAFVEAHFQEEIAREVLSPDGDPKKLEVLMKYLDRCVQRKNQAININMRRKAALRNQGILGGRYG